MKRNNMITEDIPDIICACCILHNMCEAQDEQFCQGWLEDTNLHTARSSTFSGSYKNASITGNKRDTHGICVLSCNINC